MGVGLATIPIALVPSVLAERDTNRQSVPIRTLKICSPSLFPFLLKFTAQTEESPSLCKRSRKTKGRLFVPFSPNKKRLLMATEHFRECDSVSLSDVCLYSDPDPSSGRWTRTVPESSCLRRKEGGRLLAYIRGAFARHRLHVVVTGEGTLDPLERNAREGGGRSKESGSTLPLKRSTRVNWSHVTAPRLPPESEGSKFG